MFVTSYAHHSGKQQGDWIYVDSEQDKVDFYIDQHVKVTDLVITQDMWLASLLVKKVYIIVSKRHICNR
ncbi:DUF188 domain-containing protein [Bacillus thuringiensis]|uniref:DUF188 domain-containing protein n=1 Tax=Bacillus thuringiensis TaxID=1428 RepID=UPI003F6B5F45